MERADYAAAKIEQQQSHLTAPLIGSSNAACTSFARPALLTPRYLALYPPNARNARKGEAPAAPSHARL